MIPVKSVPWIAMIPVKSVHILRLIGVFHLQLVLEH